MKPSYMLLSVLALSMASSAVMADSAGLSNTTSLFNISPATSLPNVSPANSDLVNRGAYIARTADCMACHSEDYSGGVAIETPIVIFTRPISRPPHVMVSATILRLISKMP